MKKQIVTLIAIVLTTGTLSACSNQDVGMVTGGVIGGVAGNAITGGSTAGTVVGAVGGGLIGRSVAH